MGHRVERTRRPGTHYSSADFLERVGLFALVILGAAKAETAHRRGDHVSAIFHGILGALALIVFFGSVVFAVSVIITK